MEKLYELYWTGNYDLIVIDTPPTRNALDFLDAPNRMTSFLEGRLLKWFLVPAVGGGRGVFRAMNLAAVAFLRVVQKVIGAEALKDTADFFANFEGMYDGFKERAQAVYELLRQDLTRFVVVVSPTDQAVEEALFLVSSMTSHHLHFGGVGTLEEQHVAPAEGGRGIHEQVGGFPVARVRRARAPRRGPRARRARAAAQPARTSSRSCQRPALGTAWRARRPPRPCV